MVIEDTSDWGGGTDEWLGSTQKLRGLGHASLGNNFDMYPENAIEGFFGHSTLVEVFLHSALSTDCFVEAIQVLWCLLGGWLLTLYTSRVTP